MRKIKTRYVQPLMLRSFPTKVSWQRPDHKNRVCVDAMLELHSRYILRRYALLYKHVYDNADILPDYVILQTLDGATRMYKPNRMNGMAGLTSHAVKYCMAENIREYVDIPHEIWGYWSEPRGLPIRYNVVGNAHVLAKSDGSGETVLRGIFSHYYIWSHRNLYTVIVLNNPRYLQPGETTDGTRDEETINRSRQAAVVSTVR